ncbi:hypothetical protein M3J09_008149 [Ascochyta lentis]
MDSVLSISSVVDGCARGFLSLANELKKSPKFAAQVPPAAIQDEFDRFKLWTGNIAAHRKGHRSLEYRLRDAANLREDTHNVLKALSCALKDASAIVQFQRKSWDEESDSHSESDASDADGEVKGLQGDTELKQLYVNVKTTITSLMRMSIAIRKPAPHDQFAHTITMDTDKTYHEPYDVQHVQAKFGNNAPYLTERLGRAMSSRRQYLAYRERHCQKLSKGIEMLGFEDSKTEHTTNSTEATCMPTLEITGNVDDDDETLSQTSYASSVGKAIRTPHLPKEASKGEPYECPLCFSLIAIHTTAAWRRHVYQDLHPYCCTFEDFPIADRLYDSRRTWSAHELNAHRTSFQCVEGCSQTFATESKFQLHVKSHHSDLAAPAIFSALKRTSAKSALLSEQATCKLCDAIMSLRKLRKHLGQHQEQLSLFALPSLVNDDDDDNLIASDRDVSQTEDLDEDGATDISDCLEADEKTSVDREITIVSDTDDKLLGARFAQTLISSDEEQAPSPERNFEPWKILVETSQNERTDASTVMLWAKTAEPSDDEDYAGAESHFEERRLEPNSDSSKKEHKQQQLESQVSVYPPVVVPAAPSPPPDTEKEDAMLRKLNDLLLGKAEEQARKEAEARKAAEQAKFERLESLLIAQQEARTAKDKAKLQASLDSDSAATEVRKRHYEDKLALLEKLILAQKDEQLKREIAADVARKSAALSAGYEDATTPGQRENVIEAAQAVLEAATEARKERESKTAEAEGTGPVLDKALAGAEAASVELAKAKRAAEEEAIELTSSVEPKAPIKFKDAVGRKFSFPWHICKTWKGMEELIRQAFLHVDVIGPHVQQGHYDLIGPDGEIILPQFWEMMIQPGWAITMHMWPMPEPSPLPSSPPPPPPSLKSSKRPRKPKPSTFFAWAAGGSGSTSQDYMSNTPSVPPGFQRAEDIAEELPMNDASDSSS